MHRGKPEDFNKVEFLLCPPFGYVTALNKLYAECNFCQNGTRHKGEKATKGGRKVPEKETARGAGIEYRGKDD